MWQCKADFSKQLCFSLPVLQCQTLFVILLNTELIAEPLKLQGRTSSLRCCTNTTFINHLLCLMTAFSTVESRSKHQLLVKESRKSVLSNLGSSEISLSFLKWQKFSETLWLSCESDTKRGNGTYRTLLLLCVLEGLQLEPQSCLIDYA